MSDNRRVMSKLILDSEDSRDYWLAHRAAIELSLCESVDDMKNVLETFDFEPLDCLSVLLGSYLEDRFRREHGETIDPFNDKPF